MVSVRHPTYDVVDDRDRKFTVSVRRLRKIPGDPFASVEGEEEEVGQHPENVDALEMDEKYNDDDDDSEIESEPEHNDWAPDKKLLESLEEGDFVLYRDGASVYGGIVVKLYNDAIEFHEVVFQKKGKRVKAVKTWLDSDGVIVVSNYRPKSSDPIIYKIDNIAVITKVTLDPSSLLPDSCLDKYPVVIS